MSKAGRTVAADVGQKESKFPPTGGLSGTTTPPNSHNAHGYRYEVPPENLSKKYLHAWRTWHIDIPVDAEGWLELVVRCWDNALNTQPTYVRTAWNWGLHVSPAIRSKRMS